MFYRIFFRICSVFLFILLFDASVIRAEDLPGKSWALYAWKLQGRWSYSLIPSTAEHPDRTAVEDSATQSIGAIKTRITLLRRGSIVYINPLPVLDLELTLPPKNTVYEFERVCNDSGLKLIH